MQVQGVTIPDVSKTFNLPIIGEFTLQLSNLQVTEVDASDEDAKLVIRDGLFDLWITQVAVNLTFNWHWEKLGMSGTGDGELNLLGGNIDYDFTVSTHPETKKPQINVRAANSHFENVALTIHSYSSDWLYQAVLSLFNDQIQKAIQNGINTALQNDVPNSLNDVLNSLPTRLEIKGLPFSTSFGYTFYTLTYVMVKGYGEIESDSPSPSMVQAGTTAASTPRHIPRVTEMKPCPFEVSPLPLDTDQVADQKGMVSIYLHESIANCMLWGLHRGNALQYSIVDGTVPKLHLTTDLLAMLIPQLPKTYPHQKLRIDMAAVDVPQVSFSVNGSTIKVRTAAKGLLKAVHIMKHLCIVFALMQMHVKCLLARVQVPVGHANTYVHCFTVLPVSLLVCWTSYHHRQAWTSNALMFCGSTSVCRPRTGPASM